MNPCVLKLVSFSWFKREREKRKGKKSTKSIKIVIKHFISWTYEQKLILPSWYVMYILFWKIQWWTSTMCSKTHVRFIEKKIAEKRHVKESKMHTAVYVMPTWTFFLQVEKSFRESVTFNVAPNIFLVSNCEEYESKMVSSNQVSGREWRCCLMQNGTWNKGKPFPSLFFEGRSVPFRVYSNKPAILYS